MPLSPESAERTYTIDQQRETSLPYRNRMAQPNFKLLWDSYPDHDQFPTLQTLHTHIGGQVAKSITTPGFGPNGNTCAMRMSRALNYSSMPISEKLVKTLKLTVEMALWPL